MNETNVDDPEKQCFYTSSIMHSAIQCMLALLLALLWQELATLLPGAAASVTGQELAGLVCAQVLLLFCTLQVCLSCDSLLPLGQLCHIANLCFNTYCCSLLSSMEHTSLDLGLVLTGYSLAIRLVKMLLKVAYICMQDKIDDG